jgi:elongator complex protein 5
MSLLSSTIGEPPRADQHLLILQSSTAQSSLPLLRQLLSRNIEFDHATSHGDTFLFCLLYRPSSLVANSTLPSDHLKIYDFVGSTPGYDDDWPDPREKILLAIQNGELTFNLRIPSCPFYRPKPVQDRSMLS